MDEGRSLKDFSNYIIYQDGKIWSHFIEDYLTPSYNKKGYLAVTLSRDDHKKKGELVHCLVARLYIPNSDPVHKTEVNHKDLDKGNPDVSNLEWVTPSRNILHAIENGAKSYETHKIPCYQYTLDWEFVAEHPSRKEAAEKIGVRKENICAVIKSGGTSGGYHWLNHKLGEEVEKEEIPGWQTWKVDPEFPRYHISDLGQIFIHYNQ